MKFHSTDYRETLGSFITGVTVIATRDAVNLPRGFTANSFTSVSLDPPLVLVCVAQAAASCEAFAASKSFSVNILSEDQKDVSGLFASKRLDKFNEVDWRWAEAGCPVLSNALATLECETHQKIVAGDHIILLGKVVSFDRTDARPLVYFQGGYVSLGLSDHFIERVDGHPSVMGCVATWEDRVLLCRKEGETGWALPLSNAVKTDGVHRGRARLLKLVERLGSDLTLSFPYSVFENETDGCVYIIYRGTLSAPPTCTAKDGIECRLFSKEDVPWDLLRADLFHTMLRRFFRERADDRFGIYSDVGGLGLSLIAEPDNVS